jgi:hypothetical protein
MPFARGPVLMYLGGGQYETVGPTEYVGDRDVIHIPAGFRTDLASVPRVFWALLPPQGVYEAAAVAHDWHCTRLAVGDCEVSSRDADGLFRRMAREGGAGLLTRWALWTGVRWGALANPHRRPGIGPDLPLMLLITAAGAAAIVGVFAAVHLLIDWAGRLI